ncbi:MAG TPA: MBL fold metallo-hydrolase [Conexibacter sp.]|nr:MBL fold metallo-hydrolase [Conexibacter sp.]
MAGADSAASPPPIALADGALWALAHPYELDGRVSTHAADARGFAPMNSYLLVEGDAALLVDTGLSVHEHALIAQLEALLPADATLSLLPTRIGEFAPICNVRALVERFATGTLYGSQGDPALWVDFRPEHAPYGSPTRQGAMADLDVALLSGATTLTVDPGGVRVVDCFPAPLRLLPAFWAYDRATRTLFTADAFTHAWRADERGPWVVRDVDDAPDAAAVCAHMTRSRFWWLAGADTRLIAEQIADVFATHEVETIAPAFGCVLHGRDVARRHHELLQEALELAGAAPSVGVAAGRWVA